MKMNFNLLIVSLFLIVYSVNCELDADDCPEPELIKPCHCDREGLSCFNELTEDNLAKVFQVNSQFKAYRSVWITQNPIKQLTANIFNGYRVFNFLIEENDLETINEDTFSGSYPIIKEMSLYKNNISYFPFQGKLIKLQLERQLRNFHSI